MYLRDNPVLQNELLANLRRPRAFVLLALYVGLLGGVVYVAWPASEKLDMTNSEQARRLINMFFIGQYLLASLMAPAFAAGAISGEKERKSFEMLLASPLSPAAIVWGKLLAALAYVAILVFASLPIVLLCLPLGGVNLYEVLALYWALLLSVATFTMLSIACSSRFQRTAASLVASYLLILPAALVGLWFWSSLEGGQAAARLFITVLLAPLVFGGLFVAMFLSTTRRLLYPPDVGSEGKEVVDEAQEMREAVGMVIRRDEFPDRLFAPPKRTDLLPDGANPVFDKEMRSELFSQGTLMLRVVIQASMALALPIMAWCLFLKPSYAPWYISYVLLFNMLVGPVFSAGTFTSERERQTLDLLLVTMLTPWQILWGKLLSGLRVSMVLTSFLMWPAVLSCALVGYYWKNLPTMSGYILVLVLSGVANAELALLCSVLMRKTSTAMMTAYLLIAALFLLPPAIEQFYELFPAAVGANGASALTPLSPFSALFSLPLIDEVGVVDRLADVPRFAKFVAIYAGLDLGLALLMASLFRRRWLVAE